MPRSLGPREDIGDLAYPPLLPIVQNVEVVHRALPTEEGFQAKSVAGKINIMHLFLQGFSASMLQILPEQTSLPRLFRVT